MKHIKFFSKRAAWLGMMGTILSASVALVSCNDREEGYPLEPALTISKIKLNVTETLPLPIGGDSLISFNVVPENPTFPVLTWSSSDEKVATVSSEGRIVAKALGKVTISVVPEIGFGALSTVLVEVIKEVVKIESIVFQNEEPTLYVGEQLGLALNISPANHTYSTLKWSSDNEAIMTVTDKGVITAHAQGTAYVTVSAMDESGVKSTVKVTVKQTVSIEEVELLPVGDELAIGEAYTLNYVLTPEDATAVTLKWNSSDEKVVVVVNGVVTAVGVGSAIITATAPVTGYSSTVRIIVAAGALRYSFANAIEPWAFKSAQGTKATFDGTKMTVIMKEQAKYRADLVLTENGSKGNVTLTAGTYRYLAIKMVRPNGGNFIFDTNNGRLKQYVANGNNQYTVLGAEVIGEPSIYYYDLQDGFGNDGGKPKYLLPTDGLGELKTFQFVVADIPNDKWGNTYDVYWVRTFKTVDDLQNYVKQENSK